MTDQRLHDPIILVHCTSVERGRLIAAEGLVPGDEGRCNYDAGRWLPLHGVYLSQSPRQIEQYRRAHGLLDCAVALVEADRADLLPDEDVIEALMGMALRDVGGRPWQEMLDDEEEMPPAGHRFWTDLRERFVRLAGPRSDAPLEPDDLVDLVAWWSEMEFLGSSAEIDPFDWAALKDRIVRAFPSMEGLAPWEKSKRVPGPIGFEGRTRILCVAQTIDGRVRTLSGRIPRDERRHLLTASLRWGA